MRALTPISLFVRLAAVTVALAALLTACSDASQTLDTASGAVTDVGDRDAESPSEAPASPASTGDTDEDDGQAPSAESVTEQPVTPSRPAPSAPVSVPLPERPPMRAPESTPTREERPAQPARNTAQADAFWRSFQQAVRSRDRASIQRGLADEVRVGDERFARSSEQVQAVLQAIVEEDAARNAYLSVDRLTHGPSGSTFETTAHYEIEGESYEVEVFGTVAEVAPGDWRLVEVGSR